MAKLQIHTRGSQILGKVAEPVKDIQNADFQTFIDDLTEVCIEYDGVGIAAPQVGHSKRLFIIAFRPNSRYKNAPEIEPVAIINPKILFESSERDDDYEGCLSIPDKRGIVSRSVQIEVEFTNRFEEQINTGLTGFLARIFQHEYDHLEGILYPDRMAPGETLISLDEYHEYIKKTLQQNSEEKSEEP